MLSLYFLVLFIQFIYASIVLHLLFDQLLLEVHLYFFDLVHSRGLFIQELRFVLRMLMYLSNVTVVGSKMLARQSLIAGAALDDYRSAAILEV